MTYEEFMKFYSYNLTPYIFENYNKYLHVLYSVTEIG